nr:MAG TPA: minor capsid protein [Caudoviricetes sp.]
MQNEYDIKKVMEEIELQLITSMKRTLWSHKEDEKTKGFNWPQWQALKIKQFEDYKKANKEIFNNNTKGLNRYLYKHIKEQFKEGAGRTNKQAIQSEIIRKEDSQLGGSFFGLNHRKLDALIKSTKDDMKDVKYATLRMANDQYRQIIYKAQVFANTGAETVKQAIDMASKDFLARGFNCIEYKNSTRHNIADYCDMAIRTANKRANLMGEGEMRKKLGNSLVYVSKHGGACDKCTPWEGRVYIDDVWSDGTEEDGEYPLLSTAIEGGLFHPRCHHGISTYYEDINEEPKEVTKSKQNHNEEEKYTQYLQQRQKQYQRLAVGSLLPENVLNYQNKAEELQNQIESSKIREDRLFEKLNIDIEKYTLKENNIQELTSKLLKMDNHPQIVNQTNYDKIKGKEIVRYLRDYKGRTAEEAYKNTLYGDIKYSNKKNSQYGRGIYFGELVDAETLNYTFGNGQGKVIRAKLSKDANILEFNSPIDYLKDISTRTQKLPKKLQRIYDNERSLIYMLEGYDGIKIKGKNYYCIFNRKVLIINDGK